MQFVWTEPFRKDFRRLPGTVQKRMTKALERYAASPGHPSLGVKKLEGTRLIWEMRITRNHRLTFEKTQDALLLRRIGTHDILRQP